MDNRLRSACAALLFLVGGVAPLQAQTHDLDPGAARHWGADAEAYITTPFRAGRRQWVEFGSTVAAVALAYQYDEKVRAHFIAPGTTPFHEAHNEEDALPSLLALGGTWIAARVSRNPDRRREAGTMLESALFATVATEVLQKISSRAQPNEASGRNDWHVSGGDAFPSAHTAFAFSIGTVLAESGDGRHRWMRRVLGYGIGTLTAYLRVRHDDHWFSDTVAGTGVGVGTARFLMQRHESSGDRAFTLLPTRDGVMLSYARQLR